MKVKQTNTLKVISDFSFANQKLVINPNDGFDLGLLMSETTVEVYFGNNSEKPANPENTPQYARLYQKNECKLGTVEMSIKAANNLGGARHVRLVLRQKEPYPLLLIIPAGGSVK
ncbi:MAG: hypothetical protein DRP87_15395 [Spirochaetes bacterium]|nr:MAG: hypothetical protein DRP87_15395 [Spirochaetota bacterium]